MRSGIIAQKVGMTRLFTPEGNHVPVTVLKVDSCEVVGVRSADKDGYVALQVGAGKAKEKNTAKPQRVQFAKANVAPKKTVRKSAKKTPKAPEKQEFEHIAIGDSLPYYLL